MIRFIFARHVRFIGSRQGQGTVNFNEDRGAIGRDRKDFKVIRNSRRGRPICVNDRGITLFKGIKNFASSMIATLLCIYGGDYPFIIFHSLGGVTCNCQVNAPCAFRPRIPFCFEIGGPIIIHTGSVPTSYVARGHSSRCCAIVVSLSLTACGSSVYLVCLSYAFYGLTSTFFYSSSTVPSFATFFGTSVTSHQTLHALAFTISRSPLRYLTELLHLSSIGKKVPVQVVSPLFSNVVPESRSVVTFSVKQGVFLSRNLVTVLHTSKMLATTALLVNAVSP